MKTIFKNDKVKEQYCDAYSSKWTKYSPKEKESLAALNNIVSQAQSLQDLRCYPPLHLEKITGKIKKRKKATGEWSIRIVGTKYRVIFIPCDDQEQELVGGDILAIATSIKIIKITEVSSHYE